MPRLKHRHTYLTKPTRIERVPKGDGQEEVTKYWQCVYPGCLKEKKQGPRIVRRSG